MPKLTPFELPKESAPAVRFVVPPEMVIALPAPPPVGIPRKQPAVPTNSARSVGPGVDVATFCRMSQSDTGSQQSPLSGLPQTAATAVGTGSPSESRMTTLVSVQSARRVMRCVPFRIGPTPST